MPELPEVEVLARHLRPLIHGKTICAVNVRRAKVLRPTPPRTFRRTLPGATFTGLSRRGKYLLFQLRAKANRKPITLLGHLGMTGRIFLAQKGRRLPKAHGGGARFGREQTGLRRHALFWPIDAGHLRRDPIGTGAIG